MSKTGQPQQSKAGFVTLTHTRCPDCRDNELGRQFLSRIPPMISRLDPKSARACERCAGRGEIELLPTDAERIDPYARK